MLRNKQNKNKGEHVKSYMLKEGTLGGRETSSRLNMTPFFKKKKWQTE